MKRAPFLLAATGLSAFFASLPAASAALVTVVQSELTGGFMNVFELPQNGGGYVFGSSWGVADLTSSFSGQTLTLGPNTIGDPNPFWYIGGGGPGAAGNKIMEASLYAETTGIYSGQTLTFTGNVLSRTLLESYTAVAFIIDFAPDYSSRVETTVPLAEGIFSITATLSSDIARHVQYGFRVTGVNVWATDAAPVGTVQIAPVPEPSSAILLGGMALAGLGAWRRRR